MTDRIKISVGDTTFILSPLSQAQKMEIADCTKVGKGGEDVFDIAMAQALLVKYSVKDVIGVKDVDGEEYKPVLENNELTEDSVAEIFTLQEKSHMLTAAWQCMNGIPDKITDPVSGKVIKGVALEILTKKQNSS